MMTVMHRLSSLGGRPPVQLAAELHQDNTPQLQRCTLLVQLLVADGMVIHRLSSFKRLMPGRQVPCTVGGGVPLRQHPTASEVYPPGAASGCRWDGDAPAEQLEEMDACAA